MLVLTPSAVAAVTELVNAPNRSEGAGLRIKVSGLRGQAHSAPRSRRMLGTATLTIVTSSRSMNPATSTTISASQRRPSDGADEVWGWCQVRDCVREF